MKKEEVINEILEREWVFFSAAVNTGGRAECQDNKAEFTVMRKSQWETFPLNVLESYLEDLKEAVSKKVNIVVEKYARMMEYSVPEEYDAIKGFLTEIPEGKRKAADKIVELYLEWEKEAIRRYPKITAQGRPLYSAQDTPETASIETYLRGEIYSYSEKTVQLYYSYIQECIAQDRNLALENIENIVMKKGFGSMEEAEESLKQS